MGIDWGVFSAILAGLFIFGAIYNWLVGIMEEEGYDEGYVWLMVVVGVLVTLLGLAAIDWRAAMLALACFAASGCCMALGSIRRHVTRRRAGQQAQRREVRP